VSGRVYLVGAGPGDPGLITRRGLDVLRACDVVLYDRLVPQELLDEAPESADRIFVGKKPGETHSRQIVADALIVQRALAGQTVVRLKGGDPFVFGRGGEEAELLAESGIPFEIVPGVTSAIAVPAYAGIPVTHRGKAASFAVLTGRDAEGEPPHRWEQLATGVDTLVLMMGTTRLEEVADRLIGAGRTPDTPAAVIEWGTTSSQRVVTGTLGDIAEQAVKERIKPPATTVVGDVVRLRERIEWFEKRPLFGVRIVVTTPEPSLAVRFADLGARVTSVPTIRIVPPESWARLDDAIASLDSFDWVLFASVNAVVRFFDRVAASGADARALGGVRIGAVGPATARRLNAHGIIADVVPARATAAELAASIGSGSGRLLWPRAEGATNEPVAALEASGWSVDEVPAYRNVPVADGDFPGEVRAGDYDVITFASGSAVRNFINASGRVAVDAVVACIGPTTAAEADRLGVLAAVVAGEHTIDGLVAAVVERMAR
jgi:uroporphyrinogen III methyltransferase / synthase